MPGAILPLLIFYRGGFAAVFPTPRLGCGVTKGVGTAKEIPPLLLPSYLSPASPGSRGEGSPV